MILTDISVIFGQTTRVLAEEQFMKRALVEKILRGLPMGMGTVDWQALLVVQVSAKRVHMRYRTPDQIEKKKRWSSNVGSIGQETGACSDVPL